LLEQILLSFPKKPTTRQLEVEQNGVKFSVEFKKVKYLRMRAGNDGTIKVSAPLRASRVQVEQFISSNSAWVEEQQRKYAMKSARIEYFTEAELKIEAVKLSEYWASRSGLVPERIRFRRMSTRWGVCNIASRVITINLELQYFPPECLEYVIIHELCHLRFRGHKEEFWRLVESFLSDYKARRKMLR
jgi:predicted metal-dependent hydrolase